MGRAGLLRPARAWNGSPSASTKLKKGAACVLSHCTPPEVALAATPAAHTPHPATDRAATSTEPGARAGAHAARRC